MKKLLFALLFPLLAAGACSDDDGGKSGPPAEDAPFVFAFEAITSTGATIAVTPQDADTYYTWNLLERTEYDARFADDPEALVAAWTGFLAEELAALRAEYGEGTWLDVLNSPGRSESRSNALDPETEYVAFAFGCDEQGRATTAVATARFATRPFEAVDPCRFDIEVSGLTQVEFTFTVTPSDPATRYYAGFCDTECFDGQSVEEVATEFIRRADAADIDWTSSRSLHTGTRSFNTIDDLGIGDLEPERSYSVVVFGVSALGERTTAVARRDVRTLAVPRSDMTFAIEVLEELVAGARIRVTPSVDDESYYAGAILKEQYAAYEGRDEAFMEYVHTSAGLGLRRGVYLYERVDGQLLVDREYVFFAFGYAGGATTPLTVVPFRTKAESATSPASLDFRFEYQAHSLYDVAIYGYAVPNADAAHWYINVYKSVDGNVGGAWVDLTDAEVVADLLKQEPDEERVGAGCMFGGDVVFCGIAVDADGEPGELVKVFVTADRSMLE